MEESITTRTLFEHPERYAEYVQDMRYWIIVCAYLDEQRNIDQDFLVSYLKDVKEYLKQNDELTDFGFCKNLSYKLKALSTKPTSEQEKMTDFELFETGTRLWAKRFSPTEIWNLNQLKGMLKTRKLGLTKLKPFFTENYDQDEFKKQVLKLKEQLFDVYK